MTLGRWLSRHGVADDSPRLAQLQEALAHAIHQAVGWDVLGAAFQGFLNEWFSRQALRHRRRDERVDRRQRGRRHPPRKSGRAVAPPILRHERRWPRDERQREDHLPTHGWALTGRTMSNEFCWPAPNPSST